MPVTRPYRRTCRAFVDGTYADGGKWQYIAHPKFADSPAHYIRAFLLIQKDLLELFDYVEPADRNLGCYSHRIHSLLIRACVEMEANCKAILRENGYRKAGDWFIGDYRKIEATHLLSQYEVELPIWSNGNHKRTPFAPWKTGAALPWYRAYNATKHDRHGEFEKATFEQLIDACCGLLVILSAQFWTEDFSPGDDYLTLEGARNGTKSGIGGYFRVGFPSNWPADMQYDFDWRQLEKDADPFETIDYSKIT